MCLKTSKNKKQNTPEGLIQAAGVFFGDFNPPRFVRTRKPRTRDTPRQFVIYLG